MCADFQQIELRILAHLSNDDTMLDLFNQTVDGAADVFRQLTADWYVCFEYSRPRLYLSEFHWGGVRVSTGD